MEKLLLIGINTRSMLNSLLKLDYTPYSVSYFKTSDAPDIENEKIILKETYGESTGSFEDNFNRKNILEISKEYIDDTDYIIPVSGVSVNDFSKKEQKKILGNRNTSKIENKYEFFKEIKDEFKTPETFFINDVCEAVEISHQKPETKYIIKPLKGSGGYDIKLLDNDSKIQLKDSEKYIMQEYVEGINLSSSVLGSRDVKKTVMNSRLLTVNDYKKNSSFVYVGNILPFNLNNVADEMDEISRKLAYKFDLMGSNGVDYILNENGLYVIEINPRIQGTFECVEKSLGINMLEAHIAYCQNEEYNIPKAKYYSYKKIIYSPVRMKYSKINLDNIYDLPHVGSITESGEPLLTIIDKDRSPDNVVRKVEKSSEIVNSHVRKHQPDTI